MTSLARKMLRKRLGPTLCRERYGRPAAFRVHEGDPLGGYDALRPTKGWTRVSGRRLRARQIMQMMLGPRG